MWSCGTGTRPDAATNSCVCKPGFAQTGTDQFGRRTCTQSTGGAGGGSGAQPAACPGPYRVRTSDGRCVWSCGTGTRPDPATNQCVCQTGYSERGVDRFGRRVCRR